MSKKTVFALDNFSHSGMGIIRRGDEVTLNEKTANELVKKGLCSPEKPKGGKPAGKGKADTGAATAELEALETAIAEKAEALKEVEDTFTEKNTALEDLQGQIAEAEKTLEGLTADIKAAETEGKDGGAAPENKAEKGAPENKGDQNKGKK